MEENSDWMKGGVFRQIRPIEWKHSIGPYQAEIPNRIKVAWLRI